MWTTCPFHRALRKTDITHRILCQVAADAFRHVGLDPCDLPQRNTGVYVGHTIGSGLAGDAYHALGIEESLECLREPGVLDEFDPTEKQTLIEELAARVRSETSPERAGDPDLGSPMAAGLISKAFGLSGPFVSVNSACASSLQALVIAARALQRGAIDMALVGGASVCSRDWLVLFSQSTALSAPPVRVPSTTRPTASWWLRPTWLWSSKRSNRLAQTDRQSRL